MLGVFLDTETTGLDPFIHVPLELAFVIVDLLSGKELVAYETLFQVSDKAWLARDLASVEINGLSRSDLEAGATHLQAAQEIEALFSGYQISNDNGFFICQNPSFDRSFFTQIIPPYRQEAFRWPYHWLDLASMYWALGLVNKQIESPIHLKLSKDSIAMELGLNPESTPHRAMNGVRHLIACYQRLVGFPAQ
jgi:oligoribonuclease